jgi:hypothetical protein
MQAQSGISEAQQAAVAAAGQESQQDQLAALARSLGLQSQVTLWFHSVSVSFSLRWHKGARPDGKVIQVILCQPVYAFELAARGSPVRLEARRCIAA